MDSGLLLTAVGTAFMAGLAGNLHCGLMCGPLAGAAAGPGDGRTMRATAWHVGRLVGYAAMGATLGAGGAGLVVLSPFDLAPVLPWLVVVGLVATAFDVSRFVKAVPGLGAASKLVARAGATLPPVGRSAALGLATPLLPCGMLYGLFLTAAAMGTAGGGTAVMAAFAVGSAPSLVLAQLGVGAARGPSMVLLRRVVPLTAAAVVAWRAVEAATAAQVCR